MFDNEKYLTTGEFLKITGMTKNALLWYEKLGLISPAYVNEAGYRYYAPEQYVEIELIRLLVVAGRSLLDCKKYIENRQDADFIPMMLEMRAALEQKLTEIQRQKGIIDMSLREFEYLSTYVSEQPVTVDMPERYYLVYPVKPVKKGGFFSGRALINLGDQCAATYGIDTSVYRGAIVLKEDVMCYRFEKKAYITQKISARIPHQACITLPAGKYVSCLHRGYDSNIGETYDKILTYIRQNGLTVQGNALEQAYLNHFNTNNSNDYLSEVSIPII